MRNARFSLAAIILFAGCTVLSAQDSSTSDTDEGLAMDDVRQSLRPVVELFDEKIPETLEPYDLELSIDPKFRDLVGEDYFRLPAKLTYGVNDHLDVFFELLSYFPSPGGDGGGTGIGETNFGAKYVWGDRVPKGYDLATGVDVTVPTPDVPFEVSDGYVRVRPYVSAATWLDEAEKLRGFSNIFYEPVIMQRTGMHHDDKRFSGNNAGISMGFIYHFKQFRPVVTGLYRWELSEPDRYHWYVEPGLVWEVPERYTDWVPGKWTLGLFYRHGEKLERDDSGIKIRVRWIFDLGKWTRVGSGGGTD